MAITSAIKPINVGYNIWQVILQKLPKNIAGLTITVTPPVGVIVEVNIFPQTWKKPCWKLAKACLKIQK